MKTGARIEELRRKRGISRQEFAAALGITPSSLWRWEHSERAIREDRLREIASLLKVTVSELIGDTAILRDADSDNDLEHRVYQDWLALPVFRGTVDLQMRGRSSRKVEVIPLPLSFVGQVSADARRKPFVVVVEGDSMKDANLCEGSLAVINPAEEIREGDAALVRMGLRYAIRWVYTNRNGTFELRPASGKYPAKLYDPVTDGSSVEFIGRVMWSFAQPRIGL